MIGGVTEAPLILRAAIPNNQTPPCRKRFSTNRPLGTAAAIPNINEKESQTIIHHPAENDSQPIDRSELPRHRLALVLVALLNSQTEVDIHMHMLFSTSNKKAPLILRAAIPNNQTPPCRKRFSTNRPLGTAAAIPNINEKESQTIIHHPAENDSQPIDRSELPRHTGTGAGCCKLSNRSEHAHAFLNSQSRIRSPLASWSQLGHSIAAHCFLALALTAFIEGGDALAPFGGLEPDLDVGLSFTTGQRKH